MAACSIFEEDEVSVNGEKGYKCGLVVESSEYVSSDEEEDPQFDYQRVRKGLVRVAWHPDGEEEVVQEKKVKLEDRSLMPGDVVRRFIEGEDSQRGYVRNTSVLCHLQILGKNKILRNVNSRDLQPLRVWDSEPGDVTLDSWVGKIEHINEEVTLKFPDGAMCQVCDDEFINELFRFEDVNEKRPRESEFCTNDYYPGQQFRGELGDLESAKWIKTTPQHSPAVARKHEHKEVILTVDKVEAKSIDVHWLCRGYAKVENPLARMEPPPRTLSGDHIARLRKLDCFEPCSVQLGDKAYYTLRPSDLVVPVKLKKGQSPLDTVMGVKTEGAGGEGAGREAGDTAAPPPDQVSVTLEDIKKPPPPPISQSQEGGTEWSEVNGVTATPVHVNGDAATTMATGDDNCDADDDADNSEYEDEDDGCSSDTGSTASGRSNTSQTSNSSTKKKKGKGLQTKLLKKKKLRKARSRYDSGRGREMRAWDKIPVEIIYTFSSIEVMWQDGTIEQNVQSTELYPIHHLDELEFFPGDFVMRSADIGTTDDTYGSVESVDHQGRTCQVRWMKPYQVGKSNRPDESIVPEEMSVYDVKDHPDYKFRPGHVVVRVGGYEESHTEAAGQVFELTQDGQLLIQWADKTQTKCYPQELYLIGDELSDLGSELDSSSDESDEYGDDSDNSTEASWETEEEEEVEKEGDDDWPEVEPDKKFELDMLLDTAKNTLQKLEDTFAQNVDITPCTIYCYREILSINRNCKELDRMLSSSYFAEPKLVETIQTIKKELGREKAAKIARQVLELFENNCKRSEGKLEKEGEENGGGVSENSKSEKKRRKGGVKDGGGGGGGGKGVECGAGESMAVEGSGLHSVDSLGDPTAAGGPEGTATPHTPDEASGPVDVKPDPTTTLAMASGGETTETEKSTSTSGPPDVSNSAEMEKALHAKDLCQEACRLLKEQIVKVHVDLEKKWKKLQEAGLLPKQDDEGVDDSLVPPEKLAAVEKLVANAAEATANAKAMLSLKNLEIKDSEGDSGAVQSPGGQDMDTEPPSEMTPVKMMLGKERGAARDGLGLDLTPKPGLMSPDQASWEPPTPQTPAEVRAKLEYNKDGFHMVESATQGHRFKNSEHQVTEPKSFFAALKKELKMLHTSLPKGIFVKGYEDRMDLFTVMIHGPARTPYEDGLFFFDVQLPNDYPTAPPSVHYISYCTDRLNPNLYEDGKVCVSLLGTWAGRGTEVWTSKSSLLQVLISIQGLILVPEPYYNEAGYEKQKGTQQGHENSRMYNEMAILKMVQSMIKMVVHPPVVYEIEVMDHMRKHAFRMIRRLDHWLKIHACPQRVLAPCQDGEPQTSNHATNGDAPTSTQPTDGDNSDPSVATAAAVAVAASPASPQQLVLPAHPPSRGLPEFPLLPASRGFHITITKALEQFKGVLKSCGVTEEPTTPAL